MIEYTIFLHRLVQQWKPRNNQNLARIYVNTRAMPECWHFNWGTYIFACHTNPSCIICFVALLTKIRLNSISNLHFTGTEPYGNYVTTWLRHIVSVKPRPPLRLSHWARATCSDALWTHVTYFSVTSMRCDTEICHMARDWIWTNSDAPFGLVMRQYDLIWSKYFLSHVSTLGCCETGIFFCALCVSICPGGWQFLT